MKVYCNRTELNRALNNVSHAVPTRTTSPILEGIYFRYDGEKLVIKATDTTITIAATISADGEGSFAFVAPSRLITAIVSKLPEEDISFDFDPSGNKLTIVSGFSVTEIMCFNSDEFPELMINEISDTIVLNKEDIKTLIRKTAFSASTEDYNGVMTGVLLEVAEGLMRMVAVNPFRIATYSVDVTSDTSLNVIIPAKLAIDIAKIISDEGDQELVMKLSGNKVILDFDNLEVIVNTVNGRFIDYKRIISKQGPISVRVKRQELLRSIDRAALLTNVKNNNLIRMNITDNTLYIKSLSDEGKIDEQVEIIKDGEDLVIGMNAKHFKDVLSVLEDEEIILHFKDQISACIITPLKGEKYRYLVLPIRIN